MNPKLRACVLSVISLLVASSVFSQTAFITNRNAASVSVINTQSNQVMATIPVHDYPSGVVVSADGLKAYIGYYTTINNYVTVINTATNSVIADIPIPGASTFGSVIDISPDGQTLYSASIDSVYAISTSTLSITGSVALGKGNSIQGMAVTTDGNILYVNGYQKVFVVDTKSLIKTDSIAVPGANFYQLAVNADNTKLYGADKLKGGLHIIDLKTKVATRLLFSTTVTDCVCVSFDGTRVYASNYTDSSICVVDGRSDTLIKRIKINAGAPLGISVTPDGKHVYEANFYSNNVNSINTETFAIDATIKVGKNPAAVGKFIASSGLLPVSFLYFRAWLNQEDVQLQWKTATETNTSFYTIQRSRDGRNFTAIGTVKASGNSSLTNSYTYSDRNAAGLLSSPSVYYRIVATDKDGSTLTGSIAMVALNAKAAALVLLPNPVRDKLTIRITNAIGKVRMTLFDINGREWYNASEVISSGKDIVVVTSALPPGTYTLRVAGSAALQQRFIKE